MPLWVGIIALFVALPGAVNASVMLYDRFFAKRPVKPMTTFPQRAGRLGIWLFNLISLALLGVVIVATWIYPPRMPAVWTATSPTLSRDEIDRLKYDASLRLGRLSWMNIYRTLINPPDIIKQQPPKYFVLISQPAENAVAGHDLGSLFLASFLQSKLSPLNLPDYSRDLDAPKFDAKGEAGITIHGRNPGADFIETSLRNCYLTHQTSDMPAGVAEYYHRLSPTTISLGDVFIWLEVGKGLPWRGQTCIDVPGN